MAIAVPYGAFNHGIHRSHSRERYPAAVNRPIGAASSAWGSDRRTEGQLTGQRRVPAPGATVQADLAAARLAGASALCLTMAAQRRRGPPPCRLHRSIRCRRVTGQPVHLPRDQTLGLGLHATVHPAYRDAGHSHSPRAAGPCSASALSGMPARVRICWTTMKSRCTSTKLPRRHRNADGLPTHCAKHESLQRQHPSCPASDRHDAPQAAARPDPRLLGVSRDWPLFLSCR